MKFGKVFKRGKTKLKYGYHSKKGKRFRRLLKWSAVAAAWIIVEDYEWKQRNQKWVLLAELVGHFGR